ncbi:hypothetical protein GCM10027436_69250 [Actinophytocola sediminis]
MDVKITSTSQCGNPYALATAMMVAVASEAPAPEDICTSPIRTARSSTKWTVASSGGAGPWTAGTCWSVRLSRRNLGWSCTRADRFRCVNHTAVTSKLGASFDVIPGGIDLGRFSVMACARGVDHVTYDEHRPPCVAGPL